jgi:hypothetical protein
MRSDSAILPTAQPVTVAVKRQRMQAEGRNRRIAAEKAGNGECPSAVRIKQRPGCRSRNHADRECPTDIDDHRAQGNVSPMRRPTKPERKNRRSHRRRCRGPPKPRYGAGHRSFAARLVLASCRCQGRCTGRIRVLGSRAAHPIAYPIWAIHLCPPPIPMPPASSIGVPLLPRSMTASEHLCIAFSPQVRSCPQWSPAQARRSRLA